MLRSMAKTSIDLLFALLVAPAGKQQTHDNNTTQHARVGQMIRETSVATSL